MQQQQPVQQPSLSLNVPRCRSAPVLSADSSLNLSNFSFSSSLFRRPSGRSSTELQADNLLDEVIQAGHDMEQLNRGLDVGGLQGAEAAAVSSESTPDARVVVTSQSSSTAVAMLLRPLSIKKEPSTEADTEPDTESG